MIRPKNLTFVIIYLKFSQYVLSTGQVYYNLFHKNLKRHLDSRFFSRTGLSRALFFYYKHFYIK